MPLSWYERLDPLDATVRCSGSSHRIRWVRGRLVLEDHDLADELALEALGGPLPHCVQVVGAVRRYVASIAPLTLWAADADPTGLSTTGSPAPWSAADERLLDALRSLPLPFRRRLALSFHVAWTRRGVPLSSWQHHPAGAVVGHALRAAFDEARHRAASRSGLADAGSTTLDLRWHTVGPGVRPSAEGRAGPRGAWVRVAVPTSWLAEHWAVDDATSGDCVILARGRAARRDHAPTGPLAGPALVARWSAEDKPGRLVLATTVLADTDPADTDPADTDPADTDPADTDPAGTDLADTDLAGAGFATERSTMLPFHR